MRRFFSFRPFIDVLFCCLLMLVAILFLLKTEEEKTKSRPPNALYQVILTWDGKSKDDLEETLKSKTLSELQETASRLGFNPSFDRNRLINIIIQEYQRQS